jgi:hypothetical protein
MYLGIALTNPVEGREQEFNDWYDDQHIRDILALPGCVSAQRFKLSDVQIPNRSCPYRYLAIYEFKPDDPKAAVAAIMERGGTPAMPRSDAVSRETFLTMIYEPVGPKIDKKRHSLRDGERGRR